MVEHANKNENKNEKIKGTLKEDEYIRPEEVSKLLKVTVRTLSNWEYEGKVHPIRTKGGHRRFLLSEILSMVPEDEYPEKYRRKQRNQRKVCYCRVSSRSQKEDLDRQVEYFRTHFPDHEVIQDIGSGLNFKRKGFNTLLDSAINGDIQEVVVTHRDRLCRFGFELIERIITEHGNGKIVVLDNQKTSPEQELVDDLLSIITVFSSRVYGLKQRSIIFDDLKRKIRSLKDSETKVISQ